MPGRDEQLFRRPGSPALFRPPQEPRQHHQGTDENQTPGEATGVNASITPNAAQSDPRVSMQTLILAAVMSP